VFLTCPTSWPTTVRLNNIAGSMVVPYSQQMAAALLASIPTLVVYLLLGRFFMRGLMAGALKADPRAYQAGRHTRTMGSAGSTTTALALGDHAGGPRGDPGTAPPGPTCPPT
jgi:hypothetical protein